MVNEKILKENKMSLLEVYKQLSERVEHEIEEVYKIHTLYIISAGALIAGIGNNIGNCILHIVFGVIGILITYSWSQSYSKQQIWKNYWIKRLKDLEKLLGIDDSWQKSKNIELNNKGVSESLHYIFVPYGIIAGISLTYGIFKIIYYLVNLFLQNLNIL